ASDIKPSDQGGRHERRETERDEQDPPDADLRYGTPRKRLGKFALAIDQTLDGLSKARRLRRCRGKHKLGVLLAVELIGALRNDAVAARDRRQLFIEIAEFLRLIG